MDPLSITAACVSLTATIAKTSTSVTVFVRAVRAARSDLDGVSRELASLTTILQLLAEDAKDIENFPDTLRKHITGILANCELVLVEVQRLVTKYDKPGIVAGSKWALAGTEDVAKLQLSLEAHKSALEIALEMVTLSMTREINKDVAKGLVNDEAIMNNQTAIKNDTSEILQEIARLRAQLPNEATFLTTKKDSDSTLARYLDDLTSYAETVCWSGEDSDTDPEDEDVKPGQKPKSAEPKKFRPSLQLFRGDLEKSSPSSEATSEANRSPKSDSVVPNGNPFLQKSMSTSAYSAATDLGSSPSASDTKVTSNTIPLSLRPAAAPLRPAIEGNAHVSGVRPPRQIIRSGPQHPTRKPLNGPRRPMLPAEVHGLSMTEVERFLQEEEELVPTQMPHSKKETTVAAPQKPQPEPDKYTMTPEHHVSDSASKLLSGTGSANTTAASKQHGASQSLERIRTIIDATDTSQQQFRNFVVTTPEAWSFHKDLTHSFKNTLTLQRHDTTKQIVAVKSYRRAPSDEWDHDIRIVREAEILALLDHPHIVQLLYFAQTPDNWLLYLKNAGSVTLVQYVEHNGPRSGLARLSSTWLQVEWERLVRSFARQIGSALRYCHLNCVHLNGLLIDKIIVTQGGDIQLAGFESIALVETALDRLFETFSYGTVLWYMLCGSVPWPQAENWYRFTRVTSTTLSSKSVHLSPDSYNLVIGILGTTRYALKTALEDPWMLVGFDTPVPDYMPERKPLNSPMDTVLHKLALFDFGSPVSLRHKLTEIINSKDYQDAVIVWTDNLVRAGAKKVGVLESLRLGWKRGGVTNKVKSSKWQGPIPDFDSLDFWEILSSRTAFPRLAMYYLAMEKMKRSESESK